MKSLQILILSLMATLALVLSGCGGSGSSSTAPIVVTDEDIIPTEPGELFTRVALSGLTEEGTAYAISVNDFITPVVAGIAVDGEGVAKAVTWVIDGESATAPIALAPLGGDHSMATAAYGVNLSGVTVGESETETGTAAVYWPASATQPAALDLTGMTGVLGAALGINESGQIVGEAEKVHDRIVPVFWNASDATITELPLGTFERGSAYFISDGGWIVGEADGRAALWTIDALGLPSDPTTLPLLTGHTKGAALAVDNEGRIVGESEGDNGVVHAVLWAKNDDGGYVIARHLGETASAQAINDGTRIAGYTGFGAPSRAAVWDTRTEDESRSAQVLENGVFSQAYGLNQEGTVVGTENHRAFAAVPQ